MSHLIFCRMYGRCVYCGAPYLLCRCVDDTGDEC